MYREVNNIAGPGSHDNKGLNRSRNSGMHYRLFRIVVPNATDSSISQHQYQGSPPSPPSPSSLAATAAAATSVVDHPNNADTTQPQHPKATPPQPPLSPPSPPSPPFACALIQELVQIYPGHLRRIPDL